MDPHGSLTKMARIFGAFMLVAGLVGALASPASAAQEPCKVRDLSTMLVYAGYGQNLQTAIDAAQPGTKLRITGVCIGTFTIGEDLTLNGLATADHPVATLDSKGAGTVLTVTAGTVHVRDLKITGGRGSYGAGGGVRNAGALILEGSASVTGNYAEDVGQGGGIYNLGALTMRGSSSVVGNWTRASYVSRGGGIWNDGTVRLTGSSLVAGNASSYYGGGIYNSWEGKVVMRQSSTVASNTAHLGGGIMNDKGTVRLRDAASVIGNDASVAPMNPAGGGIYNRHGRVVLSGSSSVNGNSSLVGGGIFNDGHLTLERSSTVAGNAASDGGGIVNHRFLTLSEGSSVTGNTVLTGDGGGIANGGEITMMDTATVTGNAAPEGQGGGIYNGGEITLVGAATVIGNSAFAAGGIYGSPVYACTTWSGAISPNTPDDPPSPTWISC
jgi:hypothetical protein